MTHSRGAARGREQSPHRASHARRQAAHHFAAGIVDFRSQRDDQVGPGVTAFGSRTRANARVHYAFDAAPGRLDADALWHPKTSNQSPGRKPKRTGPAWGIDLQLPDSEGVYDLEIEATTKPPLEPGAQTDAGDRHRVQLIVLAETSPAKPSETARNLKTIVESIPPIQAGWNA